MDGQKEQALIRRHAFCVASDQSLAFLSHMSRDFLSRISVCGKHFSRFLHDLKTIYEYKYVEKDDLGKHRCDKYNCL